MAFGIPVSSDPGLHLLEGRYSGERLAAARKQVLDNSCELRTTSATAGDSMADPGDGKKVGQSMIKPQLDAVKM